MIVAVMAPSSFWRKKTPGSGAEPRRAGRGSKPRPARTPGSEQALDQARFIETKWSRRPATRGRPGIVHDLSADDRPRTRPPPRSRTSRTGSVCPPARRAGSGRSKKEYWVLAMQSRADCRSPVPPTPSTGSRHLLVGDDLAGVVDRLRDALDSSQRAASRRDKAARTAPARFRQVRPPGAPFSSMPAPPSAQ